MTSGGDPEKIDKAKKTMVNIVIGLVIIASSFAITRFILTRLGNATGVGGENNNNGGSGREIANFIASGALGRVVQDHYPFRNQTGVKRNSMIAVTFAEPIDPSSLIENTNETCWAEDNTPTADQNVCDPDGDGNFDRPEYFGDCIEVNEQQSCDTLITDAVRIFESNNDDDVVAATAQTTYNNNAEAFTFVFDPIELLGNDESNVNYTVDLTNNIVKANGDNAFTNDRHGHYQWSFTTDTEVDVTPPHVSVVSPRAGTTVSRNRAIKITFTEAMNPIVAQGLLNDDSAFNHMIFGNANVNGEWKLNNGFRTAEFLSNESCGNNSCGEVMYCLPVNCAEGDELCVEEYSVLARTAVRLNAEPDDFTSIPLTGLMDMASNRLDGNNDGVANEKPVVGDPEVIGDNEQAPDNYFWSFTVQNTIDREPPYIESVEPLLDQQAVLGNDPLEITFSKELLNASLYNISIDEHGENIEALDLADIWVRPLAIERDGKTTVNINHREFGPENNVFYYFPQIPSTVKSVTQNCFYPGNGPLYQEQAVGGNAPNCTVEFDDDGNMIARNANCVPVNIADPNNDTACARRINANDQTLTQADIDSCLNLMRLPEISPF